MNNVIGSRATREELRSDMTINLTNSMSTETMQALVDQVPRCLHANLTIQFADGTYVPSDGKALIIGGFSGPGTLTIQGNAGESGLHSNQAVIFTLGLTHQTHCFYLKACSCPIVVKNMRFNRSNPTLTYYTAVYAQICGNVSVTGCCFQGQNQYCRAVFCTWSCVKVSNCYCGNHEAFTFGYYCSNVLGWDNKELASDNKPAYAYAAQTASTIGYYGTIPLYTASQVIVYPAGRFWV